MKSRSRFLAISLVVLLSIGVFAVAGYVQAAENDQAVKAGQKAIMEGAKKMVDGNKMIMEAVAKKGKTSPELTSADKMMTDGYNMVTKGESMMTGNTMAEGQAMVKRGSKMMLDAQKATTAAVQKMGPEMVTVCSIGLDTCVLGEKDVKQGALDWFFGGTGY